MGFSPSGDGDHVLLRIRKRGANTEWVARQIAALAKLPLNRVSYAGLKDRWAVTEQTFSLHLPGKAMPDWSGLESAEVQVLEVARNRRMVRRGGLKSNAFKIVLREVRGLDGGPPDRAAIEVLLARLAEGGAPNAFGPQRFGRGGGNLDRAAALFAGGSERRSHQRGLYISAARGHLFNRVLDARLRAGTWNRALPGEALVLEGTRSFFVAQEIGEDILERLDRLDVHPSGPLCGAEPSAARDQALAAEEDALEPFAEWRAGLAAYGARSNRRALRVKVRELGWEWVEGDGLELRFSLAPGAYATSVIRELAEVEEFSAAGDDGEGEGEGEED